MAKWLFYTGILVLCYTYIGYPLLVLLLSKVFPRPVNKQAIIPAVTVIITAYNEEAAIAKKIINTLNQDYPRDQLDIIVVSDGSTDRTDEIVNSFSGQGIRLNRINGRQGKTAAQNESVKVASGEIIVFTDATTELEPNAVRKIVENFADPIVGCVGGQLMYTSKKETVIGKGGLSYWEYEKNLKKAESKIISLIGVSGCFYAIRKEIYREIPPYLISDFVVALNTYEQGYRVIYEEDAVSYEDTLDDANREFRMRVRVAIRSYMALWEKRSLSNPMKYGFYAIQLISHKVLRYFVPLFLIDIFISNVFLLHNPIFFYIFLCQCIFYIAAIIGHWLNTHGFAKGVFSKPYYLVLANAAVLVAFIKFIRGERMITWQPIR